MRARILLSLALWLGGFVGVGCHDAEEGSAPPIEPGVFAQPIGHLATMLESHYLYQDVGQRYATLLRNNLSQGVYRDVTDRAELATRLTSDLQAAAADGHLRVIVTSGGPGGPGGGPPRPPPISEARWLSEGVAYIRFHGFPGDPDTVQAVERFLKEHASARTLIIDARTHGGGGPREMNVLFSYLFGEETVMVYMDTPTRNLELNCFPPPDATLRQKEGPEGIRRLEHVSFPKADEPGLFDAQVFYLTSKRTASAAEHLALALKRTGRATLVGETTGGANHFSCLQSMGDELGVVLPVGRTVDPDTGEDWEQVGVKPHIQVPADNALDEVLRRIQ
ncbi:hypothetical protein WA016_00973 [Myxococcus stipitatus]